MKEVSHTEVIFIFYFKVLHILPQGTTKYNKMQDSYIIQRTWEPGVKSSLNSPN
jgi:hypothetical protein